MTAGAGRPRTQREWLQGELKTRQTGLTTQKIPSRSQKLWKGVDGPTKKGSARRSGITLNGRTKDTGA